MEASEPPVEWRKRLHTAGFEVVETILLGHHLGRLLWPNNVLFVLRKDPGSGQRPPQFSRL